MDLTLAWFRHSDHASVFPRVLAWGWTSGLHLPNATQRMLSLRLAVACRGARKPGVNFVILCPPGSRLWPPLPHSLHATVPTLCPWAAHSPLAAQFFFFCLHRWWISATTAHHSSSRRCLPPSRQDHLPFFLFSAFCSALNPKVGPDTSCCCGGRWQQLPPFTPLRTAATALGLPWPFFPSSPLLKLMPTVRRMLEARPPPLPTACYWGLANSSDNVPRLY